jgi:hypothetical protein
MAARILVVSGETIKWLEVLQRNATLDVADMGQSKHAFSAAGRRRVCWALFLCARRTSKQNLGCTVGNCNLLAPW